MITICIRISVFLMIASILESLDWTEILSAHLEALTALFVSNPGVMVLFLVVSLACAERIARPR